MKRKMSLLVMAMSIIAASLLLNAPSSAQSIWLNRHDNLLALEIAKPDFKRIDFIFGLNLGIQLK